MDRITIIGLGLIGGSMGLAIKAAKFTDIEVMGYDISFDAVNTAKRRGAVDRTERDIELALENAALVIVATPIEVMQETFENIAPLLAEGAVVTEVASTKVEVMRWAEQYLPSTVHFIGGHPMAGAEVGGMDNARVDLFRDAAYCLVPSATASKPAAELVTGMILSLGATPYFVEAEEHDIMVGGISHLPLFLSTALMTLISRSPSWQEMSKLASSGFRDTSRLASSDLELSRGIATTNKAGIVRWLDGYMEVLQELRQALEESPEQLMAVFEQAQTTRDRWVLGRMGRNADSEGEATFSAGEHMTEMLMGSRIIQLMRKQETEDKDKPRR